MKPRIVTPLDLWRLGLQIQTVVLETQIAMILGLMKLSRSPRDAGEAEGAGAAKAARETRSGARGAAGGAVVVALHGGPKRPSQRKTASTLPRTKAR